MQHTTFTDKEEVASVIEESLQDTDKFVSLVEVLSELVANKLPEKPKVLHS